MIHTGTNCDIFCYKMFVHITVANCPFSRANNNQAEQTGYPDPQLDLLRYLLSIQTYFDRPLKFYVKNT